MKRLSAALILGFLVSSFCFAQTQTGNASYNSSKPGLTISHSSLSFNTRVLVTNLGNGRSVEASVNGRIPPSGERIADISRDAGDALGIDKTGMTLVSIEVLPVRAAQAAEPAPAAPAASQGQEPAPGQASQGQAAAQVQPPPPQQAAPPPAQILPLQTITDVQYVPVPASSGRSCNTPLLWVILILLILVIILLLVILLLILRRLLLWPWHYPVWYRRHLLYAQRRRINKRAV
jgi:hypothetical protein